MNSDTLISMNMKAMSMIISNVHRAADVILSSRHFGRGLTNS